MASFQQHLLMFGRLLRSRGLDVPVGRMLDATEALLLIDIGRRDEVFHTLRALFVCRHEDLAVFDRAFETFWRSAAAHPEAAEDRASGSAPAKADENAVERSVEAVPVLTAADGTLPESEAPAGDVPTWSNVDALGAKDFSAFTADELNLARTAISRLVWEPGVRRTRRWIGGRGPRVDLRRALAHSLRTGGEVLTLPRLRAAPGRVRSCCCATSAARWSATRACFSSSPT